MTTTARPLCRALAALLVCIAGSTTALAATDAALAARIDRVLAKTPLVDGHNDLPWEIHDRYPGPDLLDLAADTAKLAPPKPGASPLMTDIPRLRAGRVGAQFWSVWISPKITGADAIKLTIEQIDLVHAMTSRYPNDFAFATSADDIVRIHKAKKIASLIGVEGGHQIGNSLPALRQMYALGVRYLTLTHTSNTDWADSATDTPKYGGLTAFGREIVREMNRLGMLVDLSHVSPDTMKATLAIAQAPVIFSHSGARGLIDHPRGVPDDVLKLVAKNGGIVMVNFYPGYVSADYARWEADKAAETARYNAPPYSGLYIGQPERAKAALAEWEKTHPAPPVTIAMVADHFDHIRKVAGVDHVGIGSDFDGIPVTPAGLDGPDKYPALLAELARRGWTDDELAKAAGANLLRVMRGAEAAAKKLQATERPSFATIETLDKAK